MQCQEYEELWSAYVEAAREWRRVTRGRPGTTVYSAGLSRRAAVLKDSAKERALKHKRKCLLCTNIDAASDKLA